MALSWNALSLGTVPLIRSPSFSIVLHLDVIAILAMSSFCVIYLIIKNIQTIILILGRYKHPCMFF
uniref:Uncharacterized protein n=1 Tax=Physcomitrium patens TaxID=3218 RepID=A0A2K1K1L5_PHYPA|nr:hypothetical protein PHYPA_012146 [Physcomitrium patens]